MYTPFRNGQCFNLNTHQTWRFGYKAHIGVDKDNGLVHTVEATAANSGRKIKYRIDHRPSQLKKLGRSGQYAAKKAEHTKSSIRAKVEHVFGVDKRQLRFRKTRYRGLEK